MLRIGEVAEIIEVPVHTLHYWERMFKEELSPYRSRGGQRRYSGTDLEKIREVKRLLKEEGYSIKGVKRIVAKVSGIKNHFAFLREGNQIGRRSLRRSPGLIREKYGDR